MADQTGAPPDHKAIAEKLLTAANDGAKSLKALFFWYVGALAYAVISVAGVTDEQLLKASPLKLPILSVDIPLVEYFAILPLVVVLIHLELLVQFALLSNKVNDLKSGLRHLAADEASDFRLRLENFMLSHLLAGKHHAILHTLLFLLVYGALVVMPLLTLLMIQGQFLAYHSEPMMWWHRMLVLLDAGALLYFWPNLSHREDMKAGTWIRLMAVRVVPRCILFLLVLCALYALLAWFRWPMPRIAATLGAVMIVTIIASQRAPSWRRGLLVLHAAGDWIARYALAPLYLLASAAVAYWIDCAVMEYTLPLLTLAVLAVALAIILYIWRCGAGLSPLAQWVTLSRRMRAWHRFGHRHDGPGMSVFAAQCVLAIAASALLLVVPSPSEWRVSLISVCGGLNPDRTPVDRPGGVPDASLHWLLTPAVSRPDFAADRVSDDMPAGVSADWCEDTWADTLAGDSVDFRASIPAIVLKSAGKNRVLRLDEKTLASHDLTPDQREKLRAGDPVARTGIEPIDLRGRNLTGIQANDAVMPRVKVDPDTKLSNGSFTGAQLQGASFKEALLTGVMFDNAQLQAADFEVATLSSAYLAAAQLDGANLSEAQADGSILDEATIRGADINAILRGASIQQARLTGSNLDSADLSGATVTDSDLRGVEAQGINLEGAWMRSVLLQGANLAQAELKFAVLSDLQTGMLRPDDANAMEMEKEAGPRFRAAATIFAKKVTDATDTSWAEREKAPLQCLIIQTEKMEGYLPDCAFFIAIYEGAPNFDARRPTLAFWTSFWQRHFEIACSVVSSLEVRWKSQLMFGDLESEIASDRAAQADMASAAIVAFTDPECRRHFPRWYVERLYEEAHSAVGDPEDSANVPTTSERDTELFYYDWLQEIIKLEATPTSAAAP